MPRTSAASVPAFLAEQPPDRRKEIARVRAMIRKNLPSGFEETLSKGMIVYQVPMSRYSDTYNGHPLWYVAIAPQKNYLSLHFMPVYGSPVQEKKLRDGFAAAGKRLDMGKACIRFQSAGDLALDTIGEIIAGISVDDWIARAKSARRR